MYFDHVFYQSIGLLKYGGIGVSRRCDFIIDGNMYACMYVYSRSDEEYLKRRLDKKTVGCLRCKK